MTSPILARTAAWLVALVVALALAGCDNGGGSDGSPGPASRSEGRSGPTLEVDGEQVPVARLEDAATALCTARDEARADVLKASTTFYDRSHDALHTIARALEGVDRAQAARLLEDKQRVEADLAASGSTAADVAAHLDDLAKVTRTGLATLSITVTACP